MSSLACNDKLKFSSFKEANAASVVANHQRGTKLKAYRCKHCEWWHLASSY